MLKLLITGFLIYFVYRYFIAPPAIDDQSASRKDKQDDTDDDYIDYEEVD
jgi:hypothetical protein